jgi:NAD(P)-dependent dehydrogenase (short-subunit alcohol dehydrogenase family)
MSSSASVAPLGWAVLVTGADAGVGRAAALAFARHGARVALVASGAEAGAAELKNAVAQIRRTGGYAKAFPADLTDPRAAEHVARDAEASLGAIDVWVNAMFTRGFAQFTQMEPEEFKRVTEVDYLSYVYGTRAALKRMLPRDRGVVVQVGLAPASRGIPLRSAHCGAKHAVQGFNESLRCELLDSKSSVRVTMVQLPAVDGLQLDEAAAMIVHAAEHPERREYQVNGSFGERNPGRDLQLWASRHQVALAAVGAAAAGLAMSVAGRRR